jgi:hypothetical protein
MKKRNVVLIDSIGCVFNIREWLNECLATSAHIVGITSTFDKKDFEQLTAPRFIDNYTGAITPAPPSDEALMYGLMNYRATMGIRLIDGTTDAFDKMTELGVLPVVVIPAGPASEKLRTQCITKKLKCKVVEYRHASRKFPSHIVNNDGYDVKCIIDDSRTTCNRLIEDGYPAVLMDMPWNGGDTKAPRITSWEEITTAIEGSLSGNTGNTGTTTSV